MIRKYAFSFPVRAISKDNEKFRNKQGMYFLSKRFKDFEKSLRAYFLSQRPGDFKIFEKDDLCVTLTYSFSSRVHPDCSNLPKSTLDAFNKVIWKDDRQIKSLSVDVNYGERDFFTLEVFNIC